ncbi:DUF4397 domain-containing protein [Pedobacter sp. LMG 31464]|uniref:DUF4397 domain-containing protein n=1 Tax=Pedobacter planticolens TaxID=2679964 RepID=A0A923IWB2_9SPHI|nr:DUF4397 domain-containing protein [Pedobacter planticolens]MBB2144987.1 DUF4397 domain-containing protein [Pedobacter planticolens]
MKTIFSKKSAVVLTMICMIAIVISSCKKNNNDVIVEGNANLRVVNSVQGSNPQDFYQRDTKLTTSAVAYGESSNFLTAQAGASTISFRNSGSTTANVTANVGIKTNASYTVFYYSNAAGGAQINGYEEDNTAPASGKSKVRFINVGSALTNSINVVAAGGASLTTGLTFGYGSVYTTIDANTALNVTVLGSATSTAISGATFASGKIYTIWFDAASTTTANYHVIVQN